MCDQQKSVSPFHTNFSAFGLVLLLALGTLIILVNLIIPRLVERIRTARDFGSRAQTCWQMDEMLQTQALGYEIANVGTWCDVKYKRESGDTADSKKGKTWKRWGISSEKYPRTVTAEQLPSLYQCTEEKGRCKSESAPSSMQEVVVEVKHEEDVKPAATWPLMGSEQA
jgi:competence protein ComGC